MKTWAEKFYNSDDWARTRDAYMQTAGYLCERCSVPGNPITAKIVHHKIQLTPGNINNLYITLAWDNLEALCQDCHNREHHKTSDVKRYSFDAQGNINLTIPPIKYQACGSLDTEGRG